MVSGKVADCGRIRKEKSKNGGYREKENGKEEDEWRREMKRAADGSAKKRAKVGGYGVNG